MKSRLHLRFRRRVVSVFRHLIDFSFLRVELQRAFEGAPEG